MHVFQIVRSLARVASCMIVAAAQSAAAEPPGTADGDVQSVTAFKIVPLAELSPQQLSHPVVPALRWAYEGLDRIRRDVRDYTCRLVARERINGKLKDYESMQVKIRHRREQEGSTVPFSVYLRYSGPSRLEGREVLYVAVSGQSKMLVRNGGRRNLQDVTLSLSPMSPRAMDNNRYPLTEIGMVTLLDRLIQVGHETLHTDKDSECRVRFIEGAKINGRSCTCVQVELPVRRDNLRFHLARIFVDDQTQLPVRYASYGWPTRVGDAPRLWEEYTYLDVKANVGLTDRDFDRANPAYQFYRPRNVDRTRE